MPEVTKEQALAAAEAMSKNDDPYLSCIGSLAWRVIKLEDKVEELEKRLDRTAANARKGEQAWAMQQPLA